jgi:hypothetical protein
MASRMEYAQQPVARCLERMERTADEIADAMGDRGDEALSRRPAPGSWSAKEVVCHLRDIEELFMLRFRTMLSIDEPTFLVLGEMPPDPAAWGIVDGDALPLDPDRWAAERQYQRNDAGVALAALRRRREETRALIAAHDDKHLAQLRRALEGRP